MNGFVEGNDKLIDQITWSPDGRWIYANYEPRGDRLALINQIGALSYPDAKFRAITNDASDHITVSVSADGKTLATIQTHNQNEIDVLPGTGRGSPAVIPGIPRQEFANSVDWTPEGELLISQGLRLVRVRPDGSGAVTILNDPASYISDVAACDSGRSVMLSWFFHGGGGNSMRIWRAKADGSDPTPLSPALVEALWNCSPDGKWVYYLKRRMTGDGLRRVSSAGGNSELVPGTRIENALAEGTAVSPDGKTLAVFMDQTSPETRTASQKIELLNLENKAEQSVRFINLDPQANFVFNFTGPPGNGTFHFTPDGRALAFPIEEKGVDNIWIQPLDGTHGQRITDFRSEIILGFMWSPDGKKLAVIRHQAESDVILLRDSASSSK